MEIVKSQSSLAFVEDSLQTMEGAMVYANALLKSKMCPNHFYGKKKEGDRTVTDFDAPKPEAVLLVLQHGREIGLSPMQSLQQIIPVNGLVSIKGDGAKALIMGSGKCASWKEEQIGVEGQGSFGFKITAKRVDTNEESSSIFTQEDAIRAGLWVTPEMAQRSPALKYGGWFKYPKRMLRYRALGFIARDMFSDVLQGTYIEEEARDIDQDVNSQVDDRSGLAINNSKIEVGKKVEAEAQKIGAPATAAKKSPLAAKKPISSIEDAVLIEEEHEPVKEVAAYVAPIFGKMEMRDTILALAPNDLSKMLDENIPFAQDLLWSTGIKRTPVRIREILFSIITGGFHYHLKDNYPHALDTYNSAISAPKTETVASESSKEEESEPASEADHDAVLSLFDEPGESGRDMFGAVKVADALVGKINDSDVLDKYSDFFNDIEDFYKFATKEQIKAVLL